MENDFPESTNLNKEEDAPNFGIPVMCNASNNPSETSNEPTVEDEEALARAQELKIEGNALFSTHQYEAAADKYSEAIAAAREGHKDVAVFYNNRATCYFKLGKYGSVIDDCTAALKIDVDYAKCLLRRAQAYEMEKKICEAYDDYQRVLKLEPENRLSVEASARLEKPVAEERERMKEEMLGKLKDLGNTLLGKIGLSIDNFKATKDPATGSYSISFQR